MAGEKVVHRYLGKKHRYELGHEHMQHTYPFLSVARHGEAIVGTVCLRILGMYGEVMPMIKDRMAEMSEEIEKKGGLIGHIKAYLQEEGQGCMLSVTQPGEIQMKEETQKWVLVENADIVFCLEEEEVENVLKKYFGEWLKG